jgi:cytoskeletal protein RodZ
VKIIVATVVAFVAVLVSGAFLMREPAPPSTDGAAEPTAQASTSPASTATASTSPASTSPASTSPASTSPASTSPASTSPPSTPSTSSAPASASPASAASIETTERVFFGRPHETIAIPGTYRGVTAAATLRIQLRVPGGWKDFPLPVVTQETGTFQAYVELGRGEHRLRLVDPATGTTSKDLTLLLL